MSRAMIFLEIEAERLRQDEKWDGPANDDLNSGVGWLSLIGSHQEDAGIAIREGDLAAFRAELVKIAALAMAAMEALDRGVLM